MYILKNIYLLSDTKKLGVTNVPTIQIKFFDKYIDIKNFDNLIFTSKNGVRALDKVCKNWKDIPAISIGKKTADEVCKIGGFNIFTSKKGYGNHLVNDILTNFSDKAILYIRPEIVASNLTQMLLENNINIQEKILYKTECRELSYNFENPIFIVTSPSTVKCLLNIEIPKSSIFIAIGKTTFQEIPKKYLKYISKYRNIDSCIFLAKNLELTK